MCHSKHRRAWAEPAAYHGSTISLDGERRARRHFPFWTLWLLWPLAIALKSLLPAYAAVGRELAGYVGNNGPAMLAGVALVVAGLVLIGRNR